MIRIESGRQGLGLARMLIRFRGQPNLTISQLETGEITVSRKDDDATNYAFANIPPNGEYPITVTDIFGVLEKKKDKYSPIAVGDLVTHQKLEWGTGKVKRVSNGRYLVIWKDTGGEGRYLREELIGA